MSPKSQHNAGGGQRNKHDTSSSGPRHQGKDDTKKSANAEGPLSPPLSPRTNATPGALPKDRTSKLDVSTNASATGATGAPSTNTVVAEEGDPTVSGIRELLGTMQSTLGALGKTFDVVGDHTIRVAALGPAIHALHHIRNIREDLKQQETRQEDQMQVMKTALQMEAKRRIREAIRPQVNHIVAELVNREIGDRVRCQLAQQIPASLREEIRHYKWQILQVKTCLHNSEARRHNALIRASGLEEPLQPLLRPLDVSQPSSPATSTTSAPVPRTSGSSVRPGGVGGGASTDVQRLSVNTDVSSIRTSEKAVTASERSPTSNGGSWYVEEPTASPLFPKDLATLVTLGPDQVRMLVREYGLGGDVGDEDGDDEGHVAAVRGAEGAKKTAGQKQRPMSAFTDMSDAGSWMNAGLGGSREDDINRFMRYIGVGFQVLPSSPAIQLGNGRSMTLSGQTDSPTIIRSPLIERPDYAFAR